MPANLSPSYISDYRRAYYICTQTDVPIMALKSNNGYLIGFIVMLWTKLSFEEKNMSFFF